MYCYDLQEPAFTSPPTQPTFGATPTFAPRPQPSAYASTPIFNQQVEEEEPEVIRCVVLSEAAQDIMLNVWNQAMAGKAG